MWQIFYTKQALKALRRMPRDTATRIRSKVMQLAESPAGSGNVKKLTDHPGFRLRVGDWRVVYTVSYDQLVVHVIRIAQRGEVYK
jgi:mRNA interferase RelE/StbE